MAGIREARRVLALALIFTSMPILVTSADEETPLVSGHVTLAGKPLASGKIVFYLDDDEFVGTRIKDGSYKIKRVPAGHWRVVIESKEVPRKYQEPETTNLQVEIKGGFRNTIDFSLVD
jgi:hypothetical protein